jgi:hypothetical protein
VIELVEQLTARYRQKGVLVDTNLLLLLLIGSFVPELIPAFKRTDNFKREDYELLVLLLEPFEKVITTPNILTEVSNLSNQLGEPRRSLYFEVFAQEIPLMEEYYIESRVISGSPVFPRFGLADTGIISLPKNQYLVITADHRLAGYLESIEIDVINFHHLRFLTWN